MGSDRLQVAIDAVKLVLTRKFGEAQPVSAMSELRDDLNLDSLDLAEVLICMEESLKVELDLISVFPLISIDDLAKLKDRI